jgi:3-ketosteroid 9alpha-monooxygenase subunit A
MWGLTMSQTEPRYAFEISGRFARGWYIVSFSQELAVGAIKALDYFNSEQVLFRGDDGRAVVVDAYCPHLGAHLAGVGCRVEGNSIRCPFHGWQFDASGACIHIPYAKKIPEQAKTALKSWPVCEKSGFIALWYDPEGGTPNWELPDIPDWGPDAWGDWRFNRRRIRAHGREVIENIVDVGHFPSVHGGRAQQFDNVFTPYTVSQESRISQHADADFIQPSFIDIDLAENRAEQIEKQTDNWGLATYHGPSIMYFRSTSQNEDMAYKSWWINYHTPVDDETIDLTSGVIVTSMTDEPLTDEFWDLYPTTAIAAFGQDIEIWSTKKYQPNPILCDGDGPINKLRKWYNRFYLPRAEEAWDEAPTVISSVRD